MNSSDKIVIVWVSRAYSLLEREGANISQHEVSKKFAQINALQNVISFCVIKTIADYISNLKSNKHYL